MPTRRTTPEQSIDAEATTGADSDRLDADAALAERLVSSAVSASPDLRAAALLDRSGRQLASTDGADWVPGSDALWEAADRSEGARVTQVHVGTEDGEVFAVRDGRAVVLAVSDRFALASLTLCDLRAVLRDLMRASLMQKPHRFLIDRVNSYAEEASAYLRRRRLKGEPFVRIWRAGGSIEVSGAGSDESRELFIAAAGLLSDRRRL